MTLRLKFPPEGRKAAVDLQILRSDVRVLEQALNAQAALMPYALCLFAVAMPMFLWVASFADNGVWALWSLAIFAVNWGATYALYSATRKGSPVRANIRKRTRLAVMAGLLWSSAIGQICVMAMSAGPAREPLLMLAAGAAIACIFFSAPVMQSLLLVGTTAAAGPILGLYLSQGSERLLQMTWGAVALAMALSLIFNRLLVRQFGLTQEREELTEARAESLARAEKLTKSKADLLATLSREIRDGLTGVTHVLAAASGAAGRAAPSREQMAAALDACRDLSGVINATLDSEQAEAGALVVCVAPFDPVRLAQDLVILSKPQAAAKGLELALHVEPEIGDANSGGGVADVARVRQVLTGLITNAITYTARGRIELRVQARGARIRFEVADTGPGLSQDELAVAFAPFARVERTCSGTPGAGLGLSLARKLARLMDGEVAADSAVGAGSCFWLELPYDPQAEREPDLVDTAKAAKAAARPCKVLVIESGSLAAAQLRTAFEQLGHQVVLTQKPARARDLLETYEVDIVVAGEGAAEEGPADIVRALREFGCDAALVAVTGGDGAEAAECLAAGADHVLRRPVNLQGLARALTGLLKTERGKRLAA